MKSTSLILFCAVLVVGGIALAELTPDQKTEARAKMATAPAKVYRDNVDLHRWLGGKDPGTPAVYRVQTMTNYIAVTVADDDTGTNERPGFMKRVRNRKILVTPAIETNRLSFAITFADVEDLKAGR